MSKPVIVAIMVILFVLHQDFWLKDNGTLVLGILPASLAYHMAFTVLAALAWLAAVKYAWPSFPEEDEDEGAGQ